MKKTTTLLLFALLFAASAFAEDGNITWASQFGGIRGMGTGADAAGAFGAVYIGGQTGGMLQDQTYLGTYDAYIVKYYDNGTEAWIREFGTYGEDQIEGVYADSTGVYVAGYTTGALPGQNFSGDRDAFVRKYDFDGNEVWTREFGTSGTDEIREISVNSSGIYVTGLTTGTLPGQSRIGGYYDSFIRKYDLDGNEVWTRQFGTTGDDTPFGVYADSSAAYVTGSARGAFPGQVNLGEADAFVRKYDPDGNAVWTRQFGTAQYDLGWGVFADATGVYVAGYTLGAFPGYANQGAFDIFLRKYDFDGNELWTKQFGTTGSDMARGISGDSAGVYVCGSVDGELPGQTQVGYSDAFVRKYDADGNENWTRQFGTTEGESCEGIFANSTTVYSVGQTNGAFAGQNLTGEADYFIRKYDENGTEQWTHQSGTLGEDAMDGYVASDSTGIYFAGITSGYFAGYSQQGNGDCFVRKYVDGSEAWTRQFGTTEWEEARAVSADSSGVYVGGFTAGTFPGQVNQGGADIFVSKYDADGNEVWVRQFGSPDDEFGYCVSANSGSIYVIGTTYGTLPGQVSLGSSDVFVVKYDSSGNLSWIRQFGTDNSEEANKVYADSTGIYVVGQTSGAFPGYVNLGGVDAFISKFDSDGNQVWAGQFGTGSSDAAYGVAVYSGGVYVVGVTSGTLPGQSSSGSEDAFIRKYDLDGNAVWTHQFGTESYDYAYGVAADSTGIYMAGTTAGAFPGYVNLAGRIDAFVRKYDFDGNATDTWQYSSYADKFVMNIISAPNGIYVAGQTNGPFPGQVYRGGETAFVFQILARTPAGQEGSFGVISALPEFDVVTVLALFCAAIALISLGIKRKI